MQRTANIAIIPRRLRRRGNSNALSTESAARLIPPRPVSEACAGEDFGVVLTVSAMLCVVAPLATFAGLKLHVDEDGSPLHASATALASEVPCAAVTVSA